ncbi:hypothetical protein XM38_027750 [Halomicronema hongdechloris C2206]|uniref:Uncharacterized protein n=1 Tax=Halomicronema hongdechloris C2206 TaxID=1641165 RepID=A0A1Z3HNF4_9CYAN|nr:hypothetical protein [Halomicronema hongdechloris]ASC71821.1 hypothetical protein XM38_027750 [Halomicronema hongdechloris C2206]
MSDKLYNVNKLSAEEIPFHNYFELLASEFGHKYEIWVRNEDFGRFVAVGVVNRSSGIAATIYLKRGGVVISNPLNQETIVKIRSHLNSGAKEDLCIN